MLLCALGHVISSSWDSGVLGNWLLFAETPRVWSQGNNLDSLFFFFLIFFSFIFISWRLITLQYCSEFFIHWHKSAMDLHVFSIPIPPPTSLSTPSLWVFPVHQAQTLVSCIQPGLVICFTFDNIHVLMLLSLLIATHCLFEILKV